MKPQFICSFNFYKSGKIAYKHTHRIEALDLYHANNIALEYIEYMLKQKPFDDYQYDVVHYENRDMIPELQKGVMSGL